MGQLFRELQRRNVIRVAAAYLVVGWIVMQVADVIGDAARNREADFPWPPTANLGYPMKDW